MNLGQMDTKFLMFVNDKNAVRYSVASERYYYINEAYKYYYARLVSCGYSSLLASVTTLDITADTNTVALPSDFLRARLLERVINSCWYPMKYIENYNYAEDPSATYLNEIPDYSFIGTNLLLKNTPTESVTAGLRLTYWPYSTDMSETTDTPADGFNTQWHGLIPLLAAIYAKGGREEQNAAGLIGILAKAEQPFNDMIDRMTVAYQEGQPYYTEAF